MVDINKLREKIVEKGFNVSTLASRIGIDRATLYRRINENGESFTIKEADAIVRELGIPPDETVCIFLGNLP